MKSIKKIKEFIKYCFDSYHLDYLSYFGYRNREDDWCEFPFDVNEEWFIQIVERASEVLGISEKDICTTNEKTLNKWLSKSTCSTTHSSARRIAR